MKALDLANYIIAKSNEFKKPISNLQLQKILYFINLVYLKRTKKFLINNNESFKAWRHGTVNENVYREYAVYGGDKIPTPKDVPILTNEEDGDGVKITSDLAEIIDKKIIKFASLDPWLLVYFNHQEHGAWFRTFKEEGNEWGEINRELIKREAGLQ